MIEVRITKMSEEGETLWITDPFEDGAVASLYIGEPGCFEWLADFSFLPDALHYAQIRAELDGTTVSNRTGYEH